MFENNERVAIKKMRERTVVAMDYDGTHIELPHPMTAQEALGYAARQDARRI